MKNEDEDIITIQKTSKAYKVGMLIGAGLALTGCAILFLSSGTQFVVSLPMIFFGVAIHSGSKFIAWWNHG